MLLMITGVLIVILIMLDAVSTTLTTRGSGFLTGPLTDILQMLTRFLYKRSATRNMLVHTGPLSIILMGLFWLVGLWFGWWLIFVGVPASIVNDNQQVPNLIGHLYYVGYTLSTLGLGDLKPNHDIARVLTSIGAFNGLIMITLMITYAIPLLNNAISRRKLAFQLSLLGDNPISIVHNGWNGTDFSALETALETVAPEIIQNAENRLVYPVLDYFYSHDPEFSLGLQIVKLDEALNIIAAGVAKNQQPSTQFIIQFRQIVWLYLQRRHIRQKRMEDSPPPLPDYQLLNQSELKLNSAKNFNYDISAFDHRRKILLQLVFEEGWEWSNVTNE